MVMQLAYTWVALVLAVSSASAGEEQKTHPVRPTDLLLTTGRADRIVVFDWSTPPKTLYTTTSKRDISALANALAVEPPKGWLRCACIPEIEVELSCGGKPLGSISLQRDLTIGFTQWSGDARLAAPEKLLRWFDARGINGPRRVFEEILTDRKTDQVASERWFGAMPPALRPLWRKLLLDPWKMILRKTADLSRMLSSPNCFSCFQTTANVSGYFLADLVLVPARGRDSHGMRTCLRRSSWTISLLY